MVNGKTQLSTVVIGVLMNAEILGGEVNAVIFRDGPGFAVNGDIITADVNITFISHALPTDTNIFLYAI